MEIYNSIEEMVGNTPILKLHRFGEGLGSSILAKCEFLNPGGSVKDRIGFYMVEEAERKGLLKPGGIIVEATAGNTGIGLAMAAAFKGYKLIAVMSEKVSKDKVNMLKCLGAETVVMPSGLPRSDPEHFMNKAIEIAEEKGAWLADQFFNGSNVEAHYKSTGPEIWRQTEGEVDVLVAGVGTGGTLSGAGKYLKEMKSSVKVVLADPEGSMLKDLVAGKEATSSSYLVEGIGQDFVPGNFDMELVDDVISVSDRDSLAAAKQLFEKEALFVGSSSGCIAHAARQYALDIEKENNALNIVAILPDGGRSYMSTVYDPEWLALKLPSS